MRKLRFAVILPLAQVVIALALFKWGHYEELGRHGLFVSTGRLLCFAINSPALLLRDVFDDLFPDLLVPNIFGYYFDEILLLPGVAVLWFFVGRGLDHMRAGNTRPPTRMTIFKVLVNTLLLVYGVHLFWIQTVEWFRYRNQVIAGGTHAYDAPFYWAWALVLILVPIVSFGKATRANPPRI